MYNSLGQVTAQQTPDAGTSHFWYDRLSRLVVSQNAKQAAFNQYSYTLYDPLGRITEVGQLTSGNAITDLVSRSEAFLSSWLDAAASTREQVTRTVYDIPLSTIEPELVAENLRNRVAYTLFFNTASELGPMTTYLRPSIVMIFTVM